jgi:hypothetical protein
MAIGTILVSTLAPLAGKLLTSYLAPKIKPVLSAVKDVELATKDLPNETKHSNVLMLIKSTPSIMAFVNKCGWSRTDLDTIISFCVLMVKKPLNDKASRDKWNAADKLLVFDFLRIVLSKWIKGKQ